MHKVELEESIEEPAVVARHQQSAEAPRKTLNGTFFPIEERTPPLRNWMNRNPNRVLRGTQDFNASRGTQDFNHVARGQDFRRNPNFGSNQGTQYARGNRRKATTYCWACGKAGHFARECTLWLKFLNQNQPR